MNFTVLHIVKGITELFVGSWKITEKIDSL